MKKLVLAGLSLGALVTAFTTPATASGPPEGRKCAFNSVTDVTTEAGVQTGQLNGGPLVHTEPGHITCSVQVNDNTHAGPDAVRADGTTGHVSILPPRPISYRATAADTVYLCTEYTSGGTTWYWSGGAVPGTGTWGTDPSAPCSQSTSIDPNPQACPVLLAIDARLGTNTAEIWQDCGPYSPII